MELKLKTPLRFGDAEQIRQVRELEKQLETPDDPAMERMCEGCDGEGMITCPECEGRG